MCVEHVCPVLGQGGALVFLLLFPLVTLLPPPPPPSIHHIPLGRLLLPPLGPSFPDARCDERADTHTQRGPRRKIKWREDLASLPTVRSLGKWRGSSLCVRLLLMTSLGLHALGLRLFLQQLNAPNHLLMESFCCDGWFTSVSLALRGVPLVSEASHSQDVL